MKNKLKKLTFSFALLQLTHFTRLFFVFLFSLKDFDFEHEGHKTLKYILLCFTFNKIRFLDVLTISNSIQKVWDNIIVSIKIDSSIGRKAICN